jgi:hypothetical protein
VDPAQARLPASTKLAVELSVHVIHLTRAGSSPCCPECNLPLGLHQPDESAPEDLLATCDGCSRWYFLINRGKHGREDLLLELPSRSIVQEIIQSRNTMPG